MYFFSIFFYYFHIFYIKVIKNKYYINILYSTSSVINNLFIHKLYYKVSNFNIKYNIFKLIFEKCIQFY